MATHSPSSSSVSLNTEVTAGNRFGENIRQASPTVSQGSIIATGTPYDTLSIATTNTGFTNVTNLTANTSVSQQLTIGGNIPIIRPPVLEQQGSTTNTSITNQPLHVDVAAAHQQTAQAGSSQYSGSSTTSSGGNSLSSPGSASLQRQPGFDIAKAMFTQADTNRDGAVSREEFNRWAQAGSKTTTTYDNNNNNNNSNNVSSSFNNDQFQYQQTQFSNQFAAQNSVINNFQTNSAFTDSTLLFDYGAIEAYNIGFQSAGDITAEQVSGKLDANNAIFKQVDTNRDGAISREEFAHWTQNGTQNPASQSYTSHANNFNHGNLFAGADAQTASILQQSGLGQTYGAY